LYITNKLYIYSLKSPSYYHVDVPSHKEMVFKHYGSILEVRYILQNMTVVQ